MTTEQFSQLLVELHAIKALLARQSAPASAAAPKAVAGKPDDIPLPEHPVAGAEETIVHFGKNKGVKLGSLSPKSQEWYAKEPEPRLRSDGTPFPPRGEDVDLREAARTLVHIRRGTIPNAGPVLSSDPVTTTMNDEVPF